MKTVAVLLSTFNGEKYIKDQIDSLLSQQGVSLKIVIRDDGSSDKTVDILNDYIQGNPNITLLCEKNCGVELSFQKLCCYASANVDADYYAFCDQDDIWMPDKLYVAISILERYNQSQPNLYFSNLLMVDEKLNSIGNLFACDEVKISKRMSLLQVFTYGCTCVFNKKALKDYCVAGYDKNLKHDNWIYILSMFLGNVYYDKTPHILYRQHGDNLSGKKVSGIYLFLQRLNNAFYKEWGHEFELYSSTLIECFKDCLNDEDYLYANCIATYRKRFKNKVYLFFSPTYRTGHLSKDLAIKTRVLFNHL